MTEGKLMAHYPSSLNFSSLMDNNAQQASLRKRK
jgi:hypothetical protein